MSYNFMESGYTRRLPVYLLLDCSSSMQGEPIVSVSEGLHMMHNLLLDDPRTVDTAYISIITFSSHATQYALVGVDQFQPPLLTATGTTAMGDAFRLLADSIEQDLTPNSGSQHGDYRPLVFLLTDGEPTDDMGRATNNYRVQLNRVKQLHSNLRPSSIVALGCGNQVNVNVLHEITPDVFLMRNLAPEHIKGFFKWLSGSITIASRVAGSGMDSTLPALPPTLPVTKHYQ